MSLIGRMPASSGAPAGDGANADSRDSTTISASATVARPLAPARLSPTELTCAPGASHSRARPARACASSRRRRRRRAPPPRTNRRRERASELRRERLCARRSRPAMRISSKARTRGTARACERACTPVPRIASTSRVLAREQPRRERGACAVRVAVMYVPSISASGVPLLRVEHGDHGLVRRDGRCSAGRASRACTRGRPTAGTRA